MAAFKKLAVLVVLLLLLGEHGMAWAIGPIIGRGVRTPVQTATRELAEEAGETLAKRTATLVAKYGDDVTRAVDKVGPRVIRLVEEAGPHGKHVVKLLARHGDEAVWIVQRPQALALFVKHGDDAAQAMLRHGEMVIPLVDELGEPAAKALAGLNGQNARRLVMLHRSGELAATGRQQELLGVIGRYGDQAMDWIWRNKGKLLVAALVAAFLADPELYINGAAELAKAATLVETDFPNEPLPRPEPPAPKEVTSYRAETTSPELELLALGGLLLLVLWIGNRILSTRLPDGMTLGQHLAYHMLMDELVRWFRSNRPRD